MKVKQVLTVALFLMGQKGYSQCFNHQIPNFYFDAENTQTITKNIFNEIVFLSVNEGSPTHPNDFELMKTGQSGNFLLSKHVLDSLGSLTPCSIIPTIDTCYIVIGTYQGIAPAGFSLSPGATINTTFYAKFDNLFNLIWFKLHDGYPLTNPAIISQITPYGIVAVPNGVGEDYVVFNFASGHDTATGTNIQSILIDKIAPSGNLVKEVHANVPSNYSINILSTISYLPANNICAITGGFFNTNIASLPVTPFIFTFNLGLTTVFNFTNYSSTYDNFVPSNVVEDQTNTHNLLFCFTTANPSPYPLACSSSPKEGSLVFMKVLAAHTGSILLSTGYTGSCIEDFQPPLTIKNIPLNSSEVMIGLNQLYPIHPRGLGMNPALLQLNTLGNVINYHVYNPDETANKLQYFENYKADSFILHINKSIDDSTQDTRIIKTDANGRTYCTGIPIVNSYFDSVVAADSNLVLVNDSTTLISQIPTLVVDLFATEACDTAFGRPGISSTNKAHQPNSIKIYPNPANSEIFIDNDNGNGICNAYVTNAMGQILIRQECNFLDDTKASIDINDLRPGLYFIEIYEKGNVTCRRQFVKL